MSELSEKRCGLITGSSCHVLFPKRSAEVGQRNYAKQLAMAKYFKFRDNVSTWQMEHGHFAEELAMNYFKENICADAYKPEFECIGEWGGSADCITPDYGVDFKCPTTLQAWLDYQFDGIDDQQYYQCQMYMMLYNKPVWKICAYLTETFRMGENGEQYPVEHDKRMIIIEVQQEKGWIERLEAITPKIIELREQFYEQLTTRFGAN